MNRNPVEPTETLFEVCPKCSGFGQVGEYGPGTINLTGGISSRIINMIPCDLCEENGHALKEDVFEYRLSAKTPKRE